MAYKYENKQAALLAKVKGKTGKISDKTHEEHLKLYTGYVNKSNALLEAAEKLGTPDPADPAVANQISSKIRDLKVDLTFALGGLKNHELYFNILGGDDPDLYSRLVHVMAADPGVKVHLYGKAVRPGRKVGHVTAVGDDIEDLRDRAARAAGYLSSGVEQEQRRG